MGAGSPGQCPLDNVTDTRRSGQPEEAPLSGGARAAALRLEIHPEALEGVGAVRGEGDQEPGGGEGGGGAPGGGVVDGVRRDELVPGVAVGIGSAHLVRCTHTHHQVTIVQNRTR